MNALKAAPARASAAPLLVARNATSAVVLAILPVTAPKAAATLVVSVVVSVAVNRLATLVVALATWLATALRARSATTVSSTDLPPTFSKCLSLGTHDITLGGEIGHVSRDCPTEAKGERVCYNCKQPGHVQAACPN